MQSEGKNREISNRYAMLVERSVDGIVITDSDGNYIEVNASMCEMTGYPREELLRLNARDIIDADDLAVQPLNLENYPLGMTVRRKRKLRRKDGSEIYVEISGGQLDDGNFQAIIRDITKQKYAEDALRTSEEKYRTIFESANDAILLIDIESGYFIDVNRQAIKQLGYTREELLELRLKDIEVPNNGEGIQNKRPRSTLGMFIFEQTLRRKDGTLLLVETSNRTIEYEGKNTMLCFVRDISLRKAAEDREYDLRNLAEALAATAASLNSTLDLNEVLMRVLEHVARVVPCDTANVMMIENGVARIVAHRGYQQFESDTFLEQIRLVVDETPSLLKISKTKQVNIVSNARNDVTWVDKSNMRWIHSNIGAPICADGKVIGVIHLDSVKPYAFNRIHAERLQAFADYVSIAVQNARLYSAVQNYASDLERQVAQRTAELSETNTILREQIAVRQRVEDALAEERNLLRTVIDNLPDMIYAKDREGRFLTLNMPAAKRLNASDPSEIIGKTDFDLFQPNIAAKYHAEEMEILATGKSYLGEEARAIHRTTGEEIWMIGSKTPLFDSAGKVIGLVGVNRDITQRKKIEQKLAEERNLLRTLIDNLPDLVYVKDLNSRFVMANQAVATFFRVNSVDDLIGKTSFELTPNSFREEDHYVPEQEAIILLHGQPIINQEITYIDDTGKRRWFTTTKVPLRDESGSIIGLVGINHEITGRKEVEQVLQTERNLLRTLIDNLPDVVYVKDRDSRFVLANQAVIRRLGLSRVDDVIGKTDFDFAGDAVGYHQEEQELFETGLPIINHELVSYNNDGSKRWDLITKVPLRDADGNITGLVGINHDISELKQAEEQLRQVVASARCLIWYAIVEDKNNNFHWDFFISNEDAAQRFLPLDVPPDKTYTEIWRASRFIEDREQIKRISRESIRAGKSSYTQEFRVKQSGGGVRWLSEDVVIKPLTPGRWSLVGVCTDITERKLSEEALQKANTELELRVTERTSALLHANSVLRQEIIERERIEQAERRRNEELEILRQASLHLTSSLELQIILEEILAYTLKLVTADDAYIFLYDGETLHYGSSLWSSDDRSFTPRSDGLTYAVARSKQRVVVSDARSHPVFTHQDWQGAVVGLPLLVNDAVRGVMTVIFENKTHDFDDNELRALELLADQAAVAIQNAQYVKQIQAEIAERKRAEEAERNQRMLAEALRDAAAVLSRTLDVNEVLDLLLGLVARVVPHDGSSVMLVKDGYAYVARYRGYTDAVYDIRVMLETAEDMQVMMTTGKPHIIDDTRQHVGWSNAPEVASIRSKVSAPIRLGDKVSGFINLDSNMPNAFTQQHAEHLQTFADQVSIALENANLYTTVQQQASVLEQRVLERTAELDRERAQLKAILDGIGEGVTGEIIENDARHRFTNRAMTELSGYDAQNWDGQLFKTDDMTGEEYALLREHVESALQEQGIWKGELKLKRPNGVVIDVAVTSTNVQSPDGGIIGTVTIVRDISQEKLLQEQKVRFIANASHELRTPLANIKTRLYLIRKQPERLEEHLDVMDFVSNRMKSLIEDMLDVSRFERGLISLEPEKVALQSLVNEVLNVQRPEAENKQITLKTDMPEKPLYVHVDHKRLTQVFTNLVVNAINYTPQGGHVTILAAEEQFSGSAYALVQVKDTGVGIAREFLSQVFKPFFRANEHTAGTGLGLTIVQEIVELHGGTIDVESEIGQGSSFNIRLPLLK